MRRYNLSDEENINDICYLMHSIIRYKSIIIIYRSFDINMSYIFMYVFILSDLVFSNYYF